MTTPTTGDLSARHVEVLRRFLRMNNALLYSGEREALDAAIAALSALPVPPGYTTDKDGSIVPGSVYDGDERYDTLPAAGGVRTPDGYHYVYVDPFGIGEEVIVHNSGGEWNGQKPRHALPYYYTTPQPSAAEPRMIDSFARKAEHMQPPDAAVGAQGGGLDVEALRGMFRALVDAGGPSTVARHGVERGADKWENDVRAGMFAIERILHPERFDEFPAGRSAAPAAVGAQGDGLRSALVRLLEAYDDSASEFEAAAAAQQARDALSAAPAAGKGVDDAMRRRAREWLAANNGYWDGDYVERLLQAILPPDALTRQPVAGDGCDVMVCKVGDYGPPPEREWATVIYDDKKIAECYSDDDAELVGAALRTYSAAHALYMAGRWDCATLPPTEQVRLWEDMRDAMGLAHGTATKAGVAAPAATPTDGEEG